MDGLIKKSVDYLIRAGVIAPEDRDVYEYGFHSIYFNAISIGIVGIIAYLLKQLPQTVLFHLTFIPLRNLAGGYHASSRIRCLLSSTLIWLISLYLIQVIAAYPLLIMAASAIPCLVVWIAAPVEHENNPLSPQKRLRMKRYCRWASVGMCIAVVAITSANFQWIGASLSLGMLTSAVLLLIAKISNHRKVQKQSA